MDLLERYIHAVKFWLPKRQQDDIAAELSEDIRSQIEEEQALLGRALTEAEIANILKKRGRPLLVANRYLPQQYLIGPVLFPIYKLVMKLVIFCYLVQWILVWAGLMSFDPGYRATHSAWNEILSAWGTFWVTALLSIGTVTIVFAVLERLQAKSRFLEAWDPQKLRPVRDPHRISRGNSTVEIAANIVFLLWWVNGMWSLTVFDRSGVRIVFAPVWRNFFWGFLLLALAYIAISTVNLIRPYWTRLRCVFRLAVDCAGSVLFCWLCRAQILAEITVSNLSSERATQITRAIDANFSKSFPFAVIACVLIVGLADVGRMVRLKASTTRIVGDALQSS